jgi:hypothetical protein
MLWERLGPDGARLVLAHLAAGCIQRAWLRYSLMSHARRAQWSTVADHLRSVGAWRALLPYSHVRREWRAEVASWRHVDDPGPLLVEARHGLWGTRSTRVP